MLCGQCGYDLERIRKVRCPECGVLLSRVPPIAPRAKQDLVFAKRLFVAIVAVTFIAAIAIGTLQMMDGMIAVFPLAGLVFCALIGFSNAKTRSEGMRFGLRDVALALITTPVMLAFVGFPGMLVGWLLRALIAGS